MSATEYIVILARAWMNEFGYGFNYTSGLRRFTDVQYKGKAERNCECGHGGKGAYHPDILTAYRAARSARFEYGEGG